MPRKAKNSEFNAYVYIKNELKSMGWNTRNPERDPNGEVYTQQECLDNPEIKDYLSKQRPENVIKVRENIFWVIEAKSSIEKLEIAFDEAAEYAKCINKSKVIKATYISGVAGNDIDGYIIKTGYINNQGTAFDILYNDRPITGFLTKEQAQYLADNRTYKLNDIEVNEEAFIKIAEEINEILHTASINKDQRATVISSVLLSMISDTLPNFNASPDVFIRDINNRAEDVLISHSKREFASQIELKLPQEDSAKLKYKNAIVKTFFALRKINIKAALNSDRDLLGKFYEVFLKYGNGAKDIGIVLTPRHVTNFAASILDISINDIVFDPACGTGGFLVSAYDKVRNSATNKELDIFKKYRIFGIEQQANVAAMAIVNMIFRGDGKNNIINENCFARHLHRTTYNGNISAKYTDNSENQRCAVTKVLMNPPFALKQDDDKEYKFIDHALNQMTEGGLLFSVLPLSVMYSSGSCLNWRKKLLQNHSLMAVISFPTDLFYPQASVESVMITVKAHIPNNQGDTLWCRIINDGYKKLKRKRLFVDENNDLVNYTPLIKDFIINNNRPKEIIGLLQIKSINIHDKYLELIPQDYLDNSPIDNDDIFKNMKTTLSNIYIQSLSEVFYENR
jgi:type I restriction-modification system DNA methylase subunit